MPVNKFRIKLIQNFLTHHGFRMANFDWSPEISMSKALFINEGGVGRGVSLPGLQDCHTHRHCF